MFQVCEIDSYCMQVYPLQIYYEHALSVIKLFQTTYI